jgi:hypothetical protein
MGHNSFEETTVDFKNAASINLQMPGLLELQTKSTGDDENIFLIKRDKVSSRLGQRQRQQETQPEAKSAADWAQSQSDSAKSMSM